MKNSKYKRLESIWLWIVAIAFSIAGTVAFAFWIYGIVNFIKGLFNG
ncbi:MAG: hypothetical protein J6T54_06515 [Fibrobacter sp.]|nr:hypothetical protein [Fibrobacter sp.]